MSMLYTSGRHSSCVGYTLRGVVEGDAHFPTRSNKDFEDWFNCQRPTVMLVWSNFGMGCAAGLHITNEGCMLVMGC
jgi:hypothetical protein